MKELDTEGLLEALDLLCEKWNLNAGRIAECPLGEKTWNINNEEDDDEQ